MSTLEPNMFTPAALSGKPSIPADQTNQFFTSVIQQLGATTPVAATGAAIASAVMHFDIAFPNVASTQTFTVTTPEKIEIIDVICRKSGAGAGNTLQVKDGSANVITNAMTFDTDKTITRPTTIDPAFNTIAAGSTFQVVNTFAAGSSLGNVTVVCRRM